jgi:hypothetical protein
MNRNFLKESTEQERQIHLNSILVLAKENIENNLNFDDSQKFSSFTAYINFWTNFSLNFKDETFVDAVSRNEFNIVILNKILLIIEKFMENSLSNFGIF